MDLKNARIRSNPPLATSTPVRGPIILSHKVKYHGAIAWCNQTRVQGLLLYMFQLYFHYLISTFSEPCYNSSTARARHLPCAPPPPPEPATEIVTYVNSNICSCIYMCINMIVVVKYLFRLLEPWSREVLGGSGRFCGVQGLLYTCYNSIFTI